MITRRLSGQVGIPFRMALLQQDIAGMLACLPDLDPVHRVELILGAALRDGRDDFAAARLFVALDQGTSDDWEWIFQKLCLPSPDRQYDDLAAAYIAARQVPDHWSFTGTALQNNPLLHPLPDRSVADQLQAGVSGPALLEALREISLYPAVALYYRQGGIWAMGPRPLLILAAYAADHSLKA